MLLRLWFPLRVFALCSEVTLILLMTLLKCSLKCVEVTVKTPVIILMQVFTLRLEVKVILEIQPLYLYVLSIEVLLPSASLLCLPSVR